MSPTYEDNDIALNLPGEWSRTDNFRPDLLQFRNSSNQQLSVTVMVIGKQALTPQETLSVVRQLYALRVKAERRALAPGDPIIDNGVQATLNGALGVYSGVEKASNRFFTGYVTAKHQKAVVIYLESITRNPRPHLELGNDIYLGLTIKPAA